MRSKGFGFPAFWRFRGFRFRVYGSLGFRDLSSEVRAYRPYLQVPSKALGLYPYSRKAFENCKKGPQTLNPNPKKKP